MSERLSDDILQQALAQLREDKRLKRLEWYDLAEEFSQLAKKEILPAYNGEPCYGPRNWFFSEDPTPNGLCWRYCQYDGQEMGMTEAMQGLLTKSNISARRHEFQWQKGDTMVPVWASYYDAHASGW